MNKFVVKNPLDKDTCIFCRTQEGKKIVLLSQAAKVPFAECENLDSEVKCRCYVALEQEKETE